MQIFNKAFFNSTSTVNDEDGLQHVNQEMEAKVSAPFVSDRFLSPALSFSMCVCVGWIWKNICSN